MTHTLCICSLNCMSAKKKKVICFLFEVDQSQVRERLKMRIGVLEECVKSFELECKSGSETMVRLTAELERERRKVACSSTALDSLKLVTTHQQMRGKLKH